MIDQAYVLDPSAGAGAEWGLGGSGVTYILGPLAARSVLVNWEDIPKKCPISHILLFSNLVQLKYLISF